MERGYSLHFSWAGRGREREREAERERERVPNRLDILSRVERRLSTCSISSMLKKLNKSVGTAALEGFNKQ